MVTYEAKMWKSKDEKTYFWFWHKDNLCLLHTDRETDKLNIEYACWKLKYHPEGDSYLSQGPHSLLVISHVRAAQIGHYNNVGLWIWTWLSETQKLCSSAKTSSATISFSLKTIGLAFDSTWLTPIVPMVSVTAQMIGCLEKRHFAAHWWHHLSL